MATTEQFDYLAACGAHGLHKLRELRKWLAMVVAGDMSGVPDVADFNGRRQLLKAAQVILVGMGVHEYVEGSAIEQVNHKAGHVDPPALCVEVRVHKHCLVVLPVGGDYD